MTMYKSQQVKKSSIFKIKFSIFKQFLHNALGFYDLIEKNKPFVSLTTFLRINRSFKEQEGPTLISC